jgi:hypothetical protein
MSLVLLFLVPLCVTGTVEQGGPLWLMLIAFASILLGWYLGRREGIVA